MSTSHQTNDGIDPELIKQAESLYFKTFSNVQTISGVSDQRILSTAAPGRVNLIGEHVDYTGGFVLPMAIGFHTVCYGSGSVIAEHNSTKTSNGSNSHCRVVSTVDPDDIQTFEYPPKKNDLRPGQWVNYVKGVVAQYIDYVPKGYALNLDIAISSNVPLGSGLSSSAALEISLARFLEEVLIKSDNQSTKKEVKINRALKCQKAENEWCNSPCGIMDQFISSAGEVGSVLLIDCENIEYEACSFGGCNEGKPTVVICNSNVQHSIGSGEYPIRVEQCTKALELLNTVRKMKSLRHATMEDIDKIKEQIDDLIYRRARHVITENDRTRKAAEALKMGKYTEMGKLMNESHSSMRDDYEVSCAEIDALVNLALSFSPQDAVYGSRLTGGGFGGCTISLVRTEFVPAFINYMKEGYKKWQEDRNVASLREMLECTCFISTPAAGVQLIDLS